MTFLESGEEEEVVGPGFGDALEPGDEFVADVTFNWYEIDANIEPERSGHANAVYRWSIGDDPDPELTFYRENYDADQPSETFHGFADLVRTVGYALAAVLAVGVALLVAAGVGVFAWRSRRGD